jgi:hypothetical protein
MTITIIWLLAVIFFAVSVAFPPDDDDLMPA